jgi:hypothetical protein
MIPGRAIASYLETLPVEKVWGIGPATTDGLAKIGVKTYFRHVFISTVFCCIPLEIGINHHTNQFFKTDLGFPF